MSQNRNAPAYQEYAATILAKFSFRTTTLQDRGLFYTMRLECWENKMLPNSPDLIAKAFGLPADEVIVSLPAVMPFFKIEGDYIICPELEDYRAHLDERKQKQSQGGKTGSAITNEKRKSAKETINDESTNPSSTSSTNPQVPRQVPRRGSVESLVKLSTEKQSQVQLSKEKDSGADTFVKEMEEYEATEEGVPRHGAINNGNNEFVRF